MEQQMQHTANSKPVDITYVKNASLDVANAKVKVINEIIPNTDKYSWSELNCFYRSWAILFESFKREYFNLFLFYVSYHSTYMPDGIFEKYSFEEFYRELLKDKFGLYIEKVTYSNEEEMHKKIKQELDNNSRILMPIDLIGLSYEALYMMVSHGHFLIIKGYDVTRKIYYILDNTHIDGGASTIYKDFTMKFCELCELNLLYFQYRPHLDRETTFFWSLKKEKNFKNAPASIPNALLEHYEHLIEVNENQSKVRYLEYEITKKTGNNSGELNSIVEKINFKTVYYDLLFKFLSETGVEDTVLSQLINHKDDMLSDWSRIRARAIYLLKRGESNPNSLDVMAEQALTKEKMFREKYIGIVSQMNLKDLIKKEQAKNLNLHDFVEKNNNKAEIIKGENKFKIVHSDQKRYDTWIMEDNAPQMLIYPEDSNKIYIETNVNVINEMGESFFAGIIVKFVNGIKLMFGNNMGNQVTLVCPEEREFSMYEKPYLSTSICLKLEYIDNQYVFCYRANTDEEWEKAYILETKERIECFGIFSKTWEHINHQVEFLDIVYSY